MTSTKAYTATSALIWLARSHLQTGRGMDFQFDLASRWLWIWKLVSCVLSMPTKLWDVLTSRKVPGLSPVRTEKSELSEHTTWEVWCLITGAVFWPLVNTLPRILRIIKWKRTNYSWLNIRKIIYKKTTHTGTMICRYVTDWFQLEKIKLSDLYIKTVERNQIQIISSSDHPLRPAFQVLPSIVDD